jgi:hypothetical protein
MGEFETTQAFQPEDDDEVGLPLAVRLPALEAPTRTWSLRNKQWVTIPKDAILGNNPETGHEFLAYLHLPRRTADDFAATVVLARRPGMRKRCGPLETTLIHFLANLDANAAPTDNIIYMPPDSQGLVFGRDPYKIIQNDQIKEPQYSIEPWREIRQSLGHFTSRQHLEVRFSPEDETLTIMDISRYGSLITAHTKSYGPWRG